MTYLSVFAVRRMALGPRGCSEPRRLWRRYLVLSPIYLLLVFFQWLGFSFRESGLAPTGEILYG
ncbi:MAG TPA: hypothetical protein VJV96_02230 [Candidatus Angelobacter sp.]|nr:hypothetical protein [Candidatus Angelobacter sp.]